MTTRHSQGSSSAGVRKVLVIFLLLMWCMPVGAVQATHGIQGASSSIATGVVVMASLAGITRQATRTQRFFASQGDTSDEAACVADAESDSNASTGNLTTTTAASRGPSLMPGKCPVCRHDVPHIATHLREKRDCKSSITDQQLLQVGCRKCGCGTVLVNSASAFAQHQRKSKCKSATTLQPARRTRRNMRSSQTDLPSTPIEQHGVEVLSPPLDVTDQSQSSDYNRGSSGVPKWADDITVADLYRLSCATKVDKALKPKFKRAVQRCCAMYNECLPHERDSAMRLILLLPKVVCGRWAGRKHCRAAAKRVLETYPVIPVDTQGLIRDAFNCKPKEQAESDSDGTLKAIMRHVMEGHLTKAAKVLMSDGRASLNDDKMAELREKHPAPSQPGLPMPKWSRKRGPRSGSDAKSLLQVIKRLPLQSAPGPSGWSYSMILLCSTTPEFMTMLTSLCYDIVDGEDVPMQDWLTASRLVALNKPDKIGIRPIAMGESFVRVICRWALNCLDGFDDILLKEQFGVKSVAGVEPVIISLNDSLGAIENKCIGIDFTNAFNTISRHKMATAITHHVPELGGLFQFLYNHPSHLITTDDTGNVQVLESATGGRQGDPLMPLFFSLAIKGLIEEIQDKFAADVSTEQDAIGGPHLADDLQQDIGVSQLSVPDIPPGRKYMWGYLDDLYLLTKDGIGLGDVIEFLQSDRIVSEYGLSVNASKSWERTRDEMISEGHSVLGGIVGGIAEDPDHLGGKLTMEAAVKMEKCVHTLDVLPLQYRLLLLRLCFFPSLNHILRTLDPRVGNDGIERYQDAVYRSIMNWSGDSSVDGDVAKVIMQLPVRMGGLGLFAQDKLRSIAFSACFVLSQGELRRRGRPVSRAMYQNIMELIELCAVNIKLSAIELLSDDQCFGKHLQRRANEVNLERDWRWVYDNLPSDLMRMRFLENCGPLARGWIQQGPTDPSVTLTNEETKYGLRKTLLSEFVAGPPNTRCSCGKRVNQSHHLTCTEHKYLRTKRHSDVVRVLGGYLARATGAKVSFEKIVGYNRKEESMKSDICYVVDGEPLHIDIGVTTVTLNNMRMETPTDEEVLQAIATEEEMARDLRPTSIFFWEDHSKEKVHKDATYQRKFRELATNNIVAVMNRMEGAKNRKYRRANDVVKPIIMTAGGTISNNTYDLVQFLLRARQRENDITLGNLSSYRRVFVGKLSCVLTKSAANMASLISKRCTAAL